MMLEEETNEWTLQKERDLSCNTRRRRKIHGGEMKKKKKHEKNIMQPRKENRENVIQKGGEQIWNHYETRYISYGEWRQYKKNPGCYWVTKRSWC